MLRAGELRHSFALQSYAEARTASGHATQTWSTYATVRGKVRTLSGHERLAAQQVQSVLTHEFSIRYRTGVHTGHRIVFDSRTFDIQDLRDVDERHEELRLLVAEVVTTGPAASPSPSSSPSTSASASPSASASASAS